MGVGFDPSTSGIRDKFPSRWATANNSAGQSYWLLSATPCSVTVVCKLACCASCPPETWSCLYAVLFGSASECYPPRALVCKLHQFQPQHRGDPPASQEQSSLLKGLSSDFRKQAQMLYPAHD